MFSKISIPISHCFTVTYFSMVYFFFTLFYYTTLGFLLATYSVYSKIFLLTLFKWMFMLCNYRVFRIGSYSALFIPFVLCPSIIYRPHYLDLHITSQHSYFHVESRSFLSFSTTLFVFLYAFPIVI